MERKRATQIKRKGEMGQAGNAGQFARLARSESDVVVDLPGTAPGDAGIDPDQQIGMEIDLRAGKELRLAARDAACIGDGNDLRIERIGGLGTGRAVRATLFRDGVPDLTPDEHDDFSAYCASLGASAVFNGTRGDAVLEADMDTERGIRDLPAVLDAADPGHRLRGADLRNGFISYRQHSVTERDEVIRDAMDTALSSATLTLEETGDDSPLPDDLEMDPEQRSAAEGRIREVLEHNWPQIERAARETGERSRTFASGIADGLAWDQDWTASIPT